MWRTFSEKVFTKRKPSTSADPLDLAAHIAFEWTDLKLSDSSFEASNQPGQPPWITFSPRSSLAT